MPEEKKVQTGRFEADPRAVSSFREWLDEQGIAFTFDSRV